MSHKILVVDDDKPIRELLFHKLSMRGFDVATAKDEKEFWATAFEQKPDLIILDIWLKNRAGTDVYNNLLSFGFDAEVPVIFITALVEGEPVSGREIHPALPAKKFALYSKPFNFEKLVNEIESLLSRPKVQTEKVK